MDDERWAPGMPVLDRQAPRVPPGRPGQPPRSVPETAPTPLQPYYVRLSAVALVCGAVAITALEFGVPLAHPLVKLLVLVAAPILVVTTADATLRVWRSAWAWMDVDRGRGLFRLSWVAAALVGLLAIVGASVIVLSA
jgi:hypothetical protein